jgi:hypothetical protein
MGSLLAGLGLLVFIVGGLPSTADGSTTEGGPAKAAVSEGVGSIGAATDAGESTTTTVGRRLSGFTEGLMEALSRGTAAPTAEQARFAGEIVGLFNEFDPEVAGALYEQTAAETEEWIQWLRARLGRCEAGEPMFVKGDRARYLYPCEHGQLEAGFEINPDTGKTPNLVMGGRGVELADPVREAAEAVMRLYDAWDPELFRRTFSEKFELEGFRRFLLDVRSENGDCSLGETDLVSVRGVMIHLDCERSVQLMKLELRQEDDRIRSLTISDPRR